MLEYKLLDFNDTTSVSMVFGGTNKFKSETEMLFSPLLLCNKHMKKVDQYHLLQRIGIVYKSIFEIRRVIEDLGNTKTGSLYTAIQVWEIAVLPALLIFTPQVLVSTE